MVISRIIKNNDKSFLFTTTLFKHLNELFESLGIKNWSHEIYQLSRGYIYCTKKRHAFPCWSMQHYRILFFRRYPHCATRSMLLEVAFIQAPDFIHRVFGMMASNAFHPNLTDSLKTPSITTLPGSAVHTGGFRYYDVIVGCDTREFRQNHQQAQTR